MKFYAHATVWIKHELGNVDHFDTTTEGSTYEIAVRRARKAAAKAGFPKPFAYGMIDITVKKHDEEIYLNTIAF